MAETEHEGRTDDPADQGILLDQREANEKLLLATIHADVLKEEAEAARDRAEASASELRAVAEFREMFVGILGHDLRNPLGAIITSAGTLLRRCHLSDPDTRVVARIINSGQRMSRMITQLLELTSARLGGGLPLERRPTDLREVCQIVVEELETSAAIQLWDVEGDVTGSWDGDRLAELISNIVGNAIEHADPGTAVEIKAYGDGAEYAVVEIKNHGLPIPPEVLPFIFEPFRRGRHRQKSKAGNLGLGLYIAHQVVLSHGGTLTALSAGGITTFTMRLPRVPPSSPAAPKLDVVH